MKGNNSRLSNSLFLITVTLWSSLQATAQERIVPRQRETKEGEYIRIPPETHQTSPAYRYQSPTFFAVQVNVDDSSRNILGDAANEPSIAVDPTDPSKMVIGWRQFNTVSSSFRQAGYAYTTNGGQSWKFPGVIEPGVFRSDPVLDSDTEGNFYYNSLTSVGPDFFCHVFKSTDGGATWDSGTFARGGDKQWMVIDRTGGVGTNHIYAYWTSYYSICAPGSFTRSADGGESYDSCVAIPQNPYWGTLAVGPYGEVFVFGSTISDEFVMARSFNARDSGSTIVWDTATVVNLDGEIWGFAGSTSPNPGGLLGQAWVAADGSTGPYRGYLYALCSVRRTSVSDPMDVMFARSTDGGTTWSSPVKINDDSLLTAWQWFGTMSVAPNGRIDVIWLDTRDNPGSVNSSLYYSHSTDAGETWAPNHRLSDPFNPHIGWPQQNKMGDYFDMISDSVGANIAWAGTFNGEQDVYYGRITLPLLGVEPTAYHAPDRLSLMQNYPNPFNPSTRIRFSVPAGTQQVVTLRIYNILGQEVATLVNESKTPGIYEVTWQPVDQASGVYFYRLSDGSRVETKKLILIR
jgi:hypothetical protein